VSIFVLRKYRTVEYDFLCCGSNLLGHNSAEAHRYEEKQGIEEQNFCKIWKLSILKYFFHNLMLLFNLAS